MFATELDMTLTSQAEAPAQLASFCRDWLWGACVMANDVYNYRY